MLPKRDFVNVCPRKTICPGTSPRPFSDRKSCFEILITRFSQMFWQCAISRSFTGIMWKKPQNSRWPFPNFVNMTQKLWERLRSVYWQVQSGNILTASWVACGSIDYSNTMLLKMFPLQNLPESISELKKMITHASVVVPEHPWHVSEPFQE